MTFIGISINTDDLSLGDTGWFRKNEKRLPANRRVWPYWSGDIAPLVPDLQEPPSARGLSAIKFGWSTAPLLKIIHGDLMAKLVPGGFADCFWTGKISVKGKASEWCYYIPKPEIKIGFYYDKIPKGQYLSHSFGAAPGLDLIVDRQFLPLFDSFRDPEWEIVPLPNIAKRP